MMVKCLFLSNIYLDAHHFTISRIRKKTPDQKNKITFIYIQRHAVNGSRGSLIYFCDIVEADHGASAHSAEHPPAGLQTPAYDRNASGLRQPNKRSHVNKS